MSDPSPSPAHNLSKFSGYSRPSMHLVTGRHRPAMFLCLSTRGTSYPPKYTNNLSIISSWWPELLVKDRVLDIRPMGGWIVDYLRQYTQSYTMILVSVEFDRHSSKSSTTMSPVTTRLPMSSSLLCRHLVLPEAELDLLRPKDIPVTCRAGTAQTTRRLATLSPTAPGPMLGVL